MTAFMLSALPCATFANSGGEGRECGADFATLMRWMMHDHPTETKPGVISVGHDGLTRIDHIAITGKNNYRFPTIKKNLGLGDGILDRLPDNASIVSIGEGTSDLASTLRADFRNTRALDVWYDRPDLPPELAKFVRENRPYLIGGSATSIPIPSGSVDLVLSHMLINNFLDPIDQIKSLNEIVRILKVGGEARIAFANISVDFTKMLKGTFGDEISVTTTKWSAKWRSNMKNHYGETLLIRRLKPAAKL